jgi:IS30 family transposase
VAVFTITADNGKEFAYHEVMTEYLKCGVYFDYLAVMATWIKEEYKWAITTYLSKPTDFKKISQSAVEGIIVKLNDRPRKKLNYNTPAKLMADHMAV